MQEERLPPARSRRKAFSGHTADGRGGTPGGWGKDLVPTSFYGEQKGVRHSHYCGAAIEPSVGRPERGPKVSDKALERGWTDCYMCVCLALPCLHPSPPYYTMLYYTIPLLCMAAMKSTLHSILFTAMQCNAMRILLSLTMQYNTLRISLSSSGQRSLQATDSSHAF